ncbi:MAG: YfdX family protein, partial [Bradyrhizobium sp.]
PADGKSAESKPADQLKKPIAWLPVDGALTINEDFTANPAKKAAVAEANKSLKSGDRRGAIEKLKLADMNIDVTMVVVPLEQTISDVHQAAGLINEGKYYEASQMLRDAQDGERFDVTSITGKPAGK